MALTMEPVTMTTRRLDDTGKAYTQVKTYNVPGLYEVFVFSVSFFFFGGGGVEVFVLGFKFLMQKIEAR